MTEAASVEEDYGPEFPPGIPFDDGTAEWSPWPVMGGDEAHLLPMWEESSEQQEHQDAVFGFHTQQCKDFQSGYCSLHRPKGKASPCFCYHFDSQHRRPPVNTSTGQLLYWDAPCHSMSRDSACPNGDSCVFAHSREEISYHPAKYKTRRCNGRGCRGEAICCFAHGESELRVWAPEKYSYWTLIADRSMLPPNAGATGFDWPPLGSTAGLGLEDWRRPFFGRAPVPKNRHKQRFCASFPDVSQCRRGATCAFAHSREEARTPLLSLEQEQQTPSALTEDFFMFQFKTLWCPVGVQHDWQACVYAHNYQDARRQVSIGYGPRPCPYWAKKDPNAEYAQRCPLGLRCPFSHGAKEQLYHPQYFRTVTCRDLRAKACPRQKLCAFFHKRAERRKPPQDSTDYSSPLPEAALPEAWVTSFLSPPLRDAVSAACAQDGDGLDEDGGGGPSAYDNLVEEIGNASAYWCAAFGVGQALSEEEVNSYMAGQIDNFAEYEVLSSARRPGVADWEGCSAPPDTMGLKGGESECEMRAYGPFAGPFDSFPGFLACGH